MLCDSFHVHSREDGNFLLFDGAIMSFHDAALARNAKDFFDAISIGTSGAYRRNSAFAEKDFYSQIITNGFKWINNCDDENDLNRAGKIAKLLKNPKLLSLDFSVDEISQRMEASIGADIAFIITVIANETQLSERGFLVQLKSGKTTKGLDGFDLRYKSSKPDSDGNKVEQAQLMLNKTQYSVFFVSVPFDNKSEVKIREKYGSNLRFSAPSPHFVAPINQRHGDGVLGLSQFQLLRGLSPHYDHFVDRFERDLGIRGRDIEKWFQDYEKNNTISLICSIYDQFKNQCAFCSSKIYGSRAENAIRVLHADSVFSMNEKQQSLDDIMSVSTSLSEFFLRDVFSYEFGDSDPDFIQSIRSKNADSDKPSAVVNIKIKLNTPRPPERG